MAERGGNYLEFQNIGKTFPGVMALKDISFGCAEGRVHALMGENGAGKSTLLKILAGNYQPTEGRMVIDGRPTVFNSTAEALDRGIAVIYQELHLLAESSVAENMYIGQLPNRRGVVDWKKLYADTRAGLARLKVDIDPRALVKTLPIGQRQMVEIAKALTRGAKIIAFDEPTSSLSTREIEQLFRVIGELRDEGKVILYVSHRMEEIFRICDEITVFKDGRYVKTFPDARQVKSDDLVRAMVGREVGDIYGYSPRPLGPVRLEVKGLLAPGLSRPADLTVRQGEVVGLFGLIGAGRSELLMGIYGGARAIAGEVLIDGRKVDIRKPIDSISNGMVLCPEDRKAEGVISLHSVRDNINLSARRKNLLARLVINQPWERANSARHVKELNIKTPSDNQLLLNLSGGNQQKTILGRWLSEDIRCILLDEPTRGIDVGAKNEIYNIIYHLAGQGIAVVFVSSDLPEVLGVSDRIVVMRDGAVVGEAPHDQATEESVLHLAMVRETKAA